MEKCYDCNNEMISLEVLNADIIDFSVKNSKKKFRFSLNINDNKIVNDIIHGEIKNVFYCNNCDKIHMILDRI